jgi:hypothetical protein
MSKHDLQARPIYHHTRESIEAHLTIVFAALVISHYIEHQTGWSIKKFVRTACRYRTVQIKAGRQILTAVDPLSDDLRQAIAKINAHSAHLVEPIRCAAFRIPDRLSGHLLASGSAAHARTQYLPDRQRAVNDQRNVGVSWGRHARRGRDGD